MNKSPITSPQKKLSQPTFGDFVFDQKTQGPEKPLPNLDTYEQLLQLCKSFDRRYVDLEFPPNKKHLIEEKNSIHTFDWANFIWQSPGKFFKDPKIFAPSNMNKSFAKRPRKNTDISKSDILQGYLGNCYFLAALASMANISEDMIKKLLISTETNKYGIYCVQICFNGEWRAVILDDSFPCYPDQRGPCFTKGNNEELWVMLLEKAWAKLHGNYERIEAGVASESLRCLTGAPVEVFFQDDDKVDLWNILKDACKNKFPMVAGADDEENLSKSKVGKKNLVPSHVYSLLSVVEIYHPSRGEQRLLKMRNPWGNKEWKGDWCDESTVWTEDLFKKLDHDKNSDDGTFFIEFKDFRESFSEVAVCYYYPEYKHTSIVFKPSKKANYFNVRIDKTGNYSLSLIQLTRKLFPDDQDVKFGVAKFLIAKMEGNGSFRYIAAKQKADQTSFIQLKNLESGNYIVYAKVLNPPSTNAGKNENDVTFSIYGSGAASIKNTMKVKGFVEKCYLNKAYASMKKQNYREIGRMDVEKAFELFDDEGFGYFFISNKGNKKFSSKLMFQKKDGLKLRGVKGNVLAIDFDLAPNSEKILVIAVDYQGYALKYTESLIY